MRFLLVIWALLFAFSAGAQDRYACIPFSDKPIFEAGETLSYGVSYKWGAVNTEVAQAHLKLEETRMGKETVYHSDVSARTAPFFDVFFKIREHFEGWFQKGTLIPQKCMTSTGAMNLDIPLVDCICDVPSLVYFVRKADLSKMEEGKRYGLNFAIDDTVFHIYLTRKGQETLKVKGIGKVRCNKLYCSVVEGAVFNGMEEVKIWLSDDANQVPVSFWAPLRVGAMREPLRNTIIYGTVLRPLNHNERAGKP